MRIFLVCISTFTYCTLLLLTAATRITVFRFIDILCDLFACVIFQLVCNLCMKMVMTRCYEMIVKRNIVQSVGHHRLISCKCCYILL